MSHERLFTVGELAKKGGVTVRTLQFYDRSGLLTPSRYSDGGRRLYGVDDLLRLQQILFYKGFGFSLEEIRDRLMTIDSAQDFAAMVLRQKSLVQRQIEYLQETVDLMDQTVAEIRKSDDIPINMVIAILAAAKQDNFFAYVVKQVGQAEIAALMGAAGTSPEAKADRAWGDLLLQLKQLHQQGADPYGPEGERLATAWWEQVMLMTGGDPALIASVLKAGADMSGWPEDAGDVKEAIQGFLSPALGNYFMQKGIVPPGMEEQME